MYKPAKPYADLTAQLGSTGRSPSPTSLAYLFESEIRGGGGAKASKGRGAGHRKETGTQIDIFKHIFKHIFLYILSKKEHTYCRISNILDEQHLCVQLKRAEERG